MLNNWTPEGLDALWQDIYKHRSTNMWAVRIIEFASNEITGTVGPFATVEEADEFALRERDEHYGTQIFELTPPYNSKDYQ